MASSSPLAHSTSTLHLSTSVAILPSNSCPSNPARTSHFLKVLYPSKDVVPSQFFGLTLSPSTLGLNYGPYHPHPTKSLFSSFTSAAVELDSVVAFP